MYTCAYWTEGTRTLEEAQQNKIEHVCRKLRLAPGETVVDIGCGWGGFLLYAQANYGIVGAASLFMIVIGLLLSWWYLKVISRSHKYSVISGKNYRPKIMPLGRWWIAGWLFIGLKISLGLVFPFLVLVPCCIS